MDVLFLQAWELKGSGDDVFLFVLVQIHPVGGQQLHEEAGLRWNEPWFQGAHGRIGGGVGPRNTPLNWLLPTSPSAWDERVLKEAVEVVKGFVMED